MDKRGIDITFNTIVVAAIALIVLIVLWAIFVGNIGKGAKGIGDVETAAVSNANDVTWCLPTTLKGQKCEIAAKGTCELANIVADGKSCKLDCTGTQKTHKVVEGEGSQAFTCPAPPGGKVDNHFYCCP